MHLRWDLQDLGEHATDDPDVARRVEHEDALGLGLVDDDDVPPGGVARRVEHEDALGPVHAILQRSRHGVSSMRTRWD